MSGVRHETVSEDEEGLRLDRWFKARFPLLRFGPLQRMLRTGQVRVDGGRVKAATRLEAGQSVRVPPLEEAQASQPSYAVSSPDAEALRAMILYEDDYLYVFNKPMGLATQGGPGLSRHLDGMLESLRDAKGQKPRLVHRLDRDTSGCLIVAKTRKMASDLAKTFRTRSVRKIYWALVFGVPRPSQGKISLWVRKTATPDGDRMVPAQHGDDGADHAVTHFSVVETAGQKVSWLSLKPVTGRTHQLRVHCQAIGHPILGDAKYFDVENWELPGGLQNRLHLLARRISLPHPAGGQIDVTAPLPAHMAQSWSVLGLDGKRFDGDADPEEEMPDR